MRRSVQWALLIVLSCVLHAAAAEPNLAQNDDKTQAKTDPHPSQWVSKLAQSAKESVVVVSFKGRGGRDQGVGTGFVVSADGLIATNMHVLGEARPIKVQLANGKEYDVEEVYASQRSLDLAIIRIKAKGLKPLTLGDSDQIKQGAAVMALGNPHGLKYSVVQGVLSARRDVDHRQMLQLAIPVEPGNSGGPVLDAKGRVVGIMTLKWAVAENLGFAMPINALKPLLKKPNPIAMNRWLTIGALSPAMWKPTMGARWRQRAGMIVVDEPGDGFGGRSLCISQRPVPKKPFEIAVTVKLDDESGAAGLIFSSDGGNRHYGFYPSSGSLRLTRFEGPDVFTWKILMTRKSQHYRPGQFNTLKVRLEKDRFLCYVNDQLIVESTDKGLVNGKVGLCKFRQTEAQFKSFEVGKKIAPSRPSAKLTQQVTDKIKGIEATGELPAKLIDSLKGHDRRAETVILEQASQLTKKAEQLRKLAAAVHQRRVIDQLTEAMKGDEPDLLKASLLIAKLDNPDVDVKGYQREVERMAEQIRAMLPASADAATKLKILNNYMFEENGFHGSRTDYYNRSNSYMSEVIDDREGLPITLSVLYMELGRRIGLKIEGVGMPLHFLTRAVLSKDRSQLVDAFDNGKLISRKQAAATLQSLARDSVQLRDEDLAATSSADIVHRMLTNLVGAAGAERNGPRMLAYFDAILAIKPESGQDRWMRARLRFQLEQTRGALQDARRLLEHHPDGVNMQLVRQLYEHLLERHPDEE